MEHKEYKVKVHLWKDASKKVDYGIYVFTIAFYDKYKDLTYDEYKSCYIDNTQCFKCRNKKCKRNIKSMIKCYLWDNEHFEIEGMIKEDTNEK